MTKILLQTTIPYAEDDWHIGRFSLLTEHLKSLKGENGDALYEVTARNLEHDENGNDKVLNKLDKSDFDELWLFAVDIGNGLTTEDCEGISKFRSNGRGLLVTRDHMDLGSSICNLAGVGKAHYFHSHNRDPDPDNHAVERAFIVFSQLLARDGKSLVLCLDQIDNLDANQVAALSAFVHALIDHSANLLVICSGVTSSIERLAYQAASWNRQASRSCAPAR